MTCTAVSLFSNFVSFRLKATLDGPPRQLGRAPLGADHRGHGDLDPDGRRVVHARAGRGWHVGDVHAGTARYGHISGFVWDTLVVNQPDSLLNMNVSFSSGANNHE